MKQLCRLSEYRLLKAAICLFLLVFFAVSGHAQLGATPVILVQPLGVSVPNGGAAAIAAAVAPSTTTQKFYWFLNGQPVVTNSAVTVRTATNIVSGVLEVISTLNISNACPTNAGNYSLRVTNGVGSAASSIATLVVTTLATAVTNVINIVSTGTGMTSNGFNIQLSGPAGSNFVIQASTDLKNWTPIATNSAPAGSVSYTDAAAQAHTFRFYRALIQ